MPFALLPSCRRSGVDVDVESIRWNVFHVRIRRTTKSTRGALSHVSSLDIGKHEEKRGKKIAAADSVLVSKNSDYHLLYWSALVVFFVKGDEY